MTPQGLVFDCDGTLADTMPVHWKAWNATMRAYGLSFSEERFYSLGGVSARAVIGMLSQEQGKAVDVQAVVEIARAHRGKTPMAVASGGTRMTVEGALNCLGILDWFQAIVTSDDVVNPKPAPDIFCEAARRMGVAPEQCRGYEDTPLGMQAIRAAGMEAVDVTLLEGVCTARVRAI